jgi:hypothetical protein
VRASSPPGRQDLIRLLSYVDDPRGLAFDLSSNERGWLLDAEAAVDFDDAILAELFPAPTLERARQTFVLLTR